ncbi:hypothetical protein E6C27_scaffold404G001060 [Cucumis melo var. makuwa]|uniref:Uncharacterized protein n=1 Tax=Cucumis melo var. makuwa TaxID=1194695 RepID=A0A5A7U6F3_CUCMM|nr:hypothetical protein E6C27_scaffold404G001060 [Cucumis melo var. makuwa]
MDRTWTVVGVGDSRRVPSSGIPGEEDQVGPCEQLDALFRKEAVAVKEPPQSVSKESSPYKSDIRKGKIKGDMETIVKQQAVIGFGPGPTLAG